MTRTAAYISVTDWGAGV